MAKILVVEDDQDLSERLKDWLTFHKHDVELIYTGPEALEFLQFGEFDIAVIDWTLPGMDGPDVCQQYRAAGGAKPILMLTGHDSAEAKAKGLAAGANEFLIKPFHLKDFTARLEALLQKQGAQT